jgi:hypothetical protein
MANQAGVMEDLLARFPDAAGRAGFMDIVARDLLPRDHHSVFWGDRMLTLDKSMGFLSESRFAEAWEQVRGAHVYDQYDNRQSIAWRMHTLVWAAKSALALPAGDFVECGVFQGDMSHVVYHAAGLTGSGRRMHLFDSFAGIDPARVAPGEYGPASNYVAHANAHYQRAGLYESVLARFADCPEISVHRGFLPEALDGRAPQAIAWLHIDLNAAVPEVQTLEALFDRVVPSGLVILDDYGWVVLRGQKDAEDEFFARRGYAVLELPTGQGLVVKRPALALSARPPLRGEPIDLDPYRTVFAGITPYSGSVPGGFTVDFLGVRTAHEFLPQGLFPGSEAVLHQTHTRLPDITDGETWFEAVNWVEAARAARGQFTMVTLGANYGAQAVGAFAAVRALNPMPCALVAVEPVPENLAWTRRHMRENGIDPDQHWLIGSAISDSNAPMLFPVGSPGSGAQNGFATNEPAARENHVRAIQAAGRVKQALASLLLHNTTGLMTNLVPDLDLPAEIKLVSCVTLRDIVSAFDRIDYIESDIQQSEIIVFPPAMPLLKQKVRRVHIGTHGAETHAILRRLFVSDGWQLIFDFPPNSRFETTLGAFETNDGVLTMVNPKLALLERAPA